MQKMTKDQSREFLSHGTRTGKLAVVRKSGQAHVTPIWFVLDGEDIVFMTHESSGKAQAIRRDNRVSMVVDEQVAPYAFVLVEGTVTVSEDIDELIRWGTTIAERYMGPNRAEEYGVRNGVAGEYLVRMHPTRMVAATGIAD
jgi:PPOX class probable F420-dependent enzyme